MPPRLIFASRELAFPPANGGQLRTQRLLRGLSEVFETCVVTYGDGEHGEAVVRELRRQFPPLEVVIVPTAQAHKRVAQLRSVAGARSWAHGRYASSAYRGALEEIASRTRPALVHFDDAGSALNGPVPGTVNVVAPHDVQYRLAAGMAEREAGVRKAFAAAEHRKLRREEPALWRRMDACVAISDVEARAMAEAGAHRVIMAPNGTDAVPRVPLTARRPDDPVRLLFVGTGTFQPNEHGLAWFVDEVLPHLRTRMHVVVDVVGTPPHRPRQAPEVVYHGRVPRVGPYYHEAQVAIVPVHYGGGSRLKTIEAMAFGVPVVSTRIGAEGLPIQPGRHFLEADDPAGFAQAIVTLADWRLEPAAELVRMLAEARWASEALFWPRIAARLASDYLSLAESAGESRAGLRRSDRQRR